MSEITDADRFKWLSKHKIAIDPILHEYEEYCDVLDVSRSPEDLREICDKYIRKEGE